MQVLLQLHCPGLLQLQFSSETGGRNHLQLCAHSECWDVAELSTALPPQVLLPQEQIPFCWSSPRRNPTQTKSVRREVMAGCRHDPAMWGLSSFLINTTLVRCHSSCLSQAGLQSHNSHFDSKQRAWPSVVGIWGWLIVRAGCWKWLLWQYFVLHQMPFHNTISSTPPQTWIMLCSGEILTVCQMMFYISYLQSSLLLHP